uniref:DUF4806 domain-containing protein n=1 Tax=Anopheles quadriannulatus TaxID=34691 RepID=A0A182XIK7_ANOQN
MASSRDKRSGSIYKFRDALIKKIEKEFEEEERLLRLQREKQANNEPSEEAEPSALMLTSDDEDPFADPSNATTADVVKVLRTLSVQIEQLSRKQDTFQHQLDETKSRVTELDRRLNEVLYMAEAVKDELMSEDFQKATEQIVTPVPGFEFQAVSNETELKDLDHRLATDEAYSRNLTKWLNAKILHPDPNHRLHQAIEAVFKREFLPSCSWKGRAKPGQFRISMSAQKFIMELFRLVGSNRFITISDEFVAKFFMKKLPFAKARLNLKGYRSSVCKRKS